jgi:hypothetical protein
MLAWSHVLKTSPSAFFPLVGAPDSWIDLSISLRFPTEKKSY